ncbi:MAG: hypothetical protein Q9195_000754 [Heterodermia aff. obscurata]
MKAVPCTRDLKKPSVFVGFVREQGIIPEQTPEEAVQAKEQLRHDKARKTRYHRDQTPSESRQQDAGCVREGSIRAEKARSEA